MNYRWKLIANLIGFFLDINGFSLPVVEIGSHQLIHFRQKLRFDGSRIYKWQHWASNVFVSRTIHSCNVAFSYYSFHGLRIARNNSFPFIHKNVSINLWIHGNNCRTPQYMCLEQASIPVKFPSLLIFVNIWINFIFWYFTILIEHEFIVIIYRI